MRNILFRAQNWLILMLLIIPSLAFSEPVLMTPEWAKLSCEAWNDDPVLTQNLFESGWIKNDKLRGFKVIQLYRTDCIDSPHVELKISLRDEKAVCIYGGEVSFTEMDKKIDYIMHAKTERWIEMGDGKYGPMKAMIFRRLKFKGPKGEAMGNMGPFKNFLLLVGSVPSDASTCP